ncbi:MAG: 50S ribosomal protein L22 [Nitrospinota bacterium]|nr:50S ribosomal protein L22 [Nitrospinota bacterium]
MDAKAILRYTRISPQKARLVADQVRGKRVDEALNILAFMNKKGAKIVRELLSSAIANARDKNFEDVDSLRVSEIMVDGGPVLKRQMPRARGRASRILKRTSHITLVLS